MILPAPLDRAHAHTDCRHARPLLDALDTGFTSIEADVHLVGEELLVGHDPEELRPDHTLQALYLDPLADRARAAGGRVHPTRVEPVQLLVDVKTDPVATYLRLDAVLRRYRRHLTRFDATRTGYRQRARAVTVVVSGNRPMDLMARQRARYAAYDGRLADLTSGADAAFMPLVSDDWTRHFAWDGRGGMPDEERHRLHRMTELAHRAGRRLRFWATPEPPGPHAVRVWRELVAAGVDLITTDDLQALRAFLLEEDRLSDAAA